jgi:AcrR family transcriptional regulator
MPTKKQTNKTYTREELAVMAVELAADLGWQHVRLSDLADEAELTLADIAQHFDDKICILCAYGRYVDQKTLKEAGEADPESSPRDRLFDVMMTRFDVLNAQREGVISILESFKTDPKQAVISLPYLGRSMSWMLEAAGMDGSGLRGAARVIGLKLVYLKTLKTWMEDDSPDMAQTMAELDKNLSRAEGIAGRFNF